MEEDAGRRMRSPGPIAQLGIPGRSELTAVKHRVPTRDLPRKGKRDHFLCLHLRCGDGEDDVGQRVFLSQLAAPTQEVPVHRKYHRQCARGTLPPKELQLPAV